MFDAFDQNKDGKISQYELEKIIEADLSAGPMQNRNAAMIKLRARGMIKVCLSFSNFLLLALSFSACVCLCPARAFSLSLSLSLSFSLSLSLVL